MSTSIVPPATASSPLGFIIIMIIIIIIIVINRGGAKYIDMDERPYCKKCFDKIPVELRRRLKKQAD